MKKIMIIWSYTVMYMKYRTSITLHETSMNVVIIMSDKIHIYCVII